MINVRSERRARDSNIRCDQDVNKGDSGNSGNVGGGILMLRIFLSLANMRHGSAFFREEGVLNRCMAISDDKPTYSRREHRPCRRTGSIPQTRFSPRLRDLETLIWVA